MCDYFFKINDLDEIKKLIYSTYIYWIPTICSLYPLNLQKCFKSMTSENLKCMAFIYLTLM